MIVVVFGSSSRNMIVVVFGSNNMVVVTLG